MFLYLRARLVGVEKVPKHQTGIRRVRLGGIDLGHSTFGFLQAAVVASD